MCTDLPVFHWISGVSGLAKSASPNNEVLARAPPEEEYNLLAYTFI